MPDYIGFPVTTDPDELAAEAYEWITFLIPNWVPNAGNLDTIILEVNARMAAQVRDVASLVPTTIFRYYGASLMNLPPDEATTASVDSTWTVRDTAGYTIPAGAQVNIPSAGDEIRIFEVIEDVVIAPGSAATAAGGVRLIASEPGEIYSGLGGVGFAAELVDPFDFVTAVTLTGLTTGGQDAELDEEYLSRLSTLLQLMAPRPILPHDFAVMAMDVAGVARALAIDLYRPAFNEIQTVTITGTTGGTFTLSFSGQVTTGIAWNASAATVQTALEALSNIAPGDVTVTGGPGGTAAYVIEFRGVYAGQDVATLIANGASLTGGAPSIVVATTRVGSAAQVARERAVTVVPVDADGEQVSTTVKTEVDTKLQAEREVNFEVYVVDPTYTTIAVTFTVVTLKNFVAAIVEADAEAAVTSYLSPANWGVMPTTADEFGVFLEWIDRPVVRYLEIAEIINSVSGVDYITALTIGLQGGSMGTVDVNLPGPAALTRPGTINGTAVSP